MTLSSAIGALAALISGAVVYLWQKRIDRQTETLRERRVAYRDYLTTAEIMSVQAAKTGGNNDANVFADYRAALARLQIVATDDVLREAIAHRDHMNNVIACLSEPGHVESIPHAISGEMKSFESLLAAMRRDALEPFHVTPSVKRLWLAPAGANGSLEILRDSEE